MKQLKRMMAGLMASLLLLASIPISALAADANTPKEEVVYINLNSNGSVREIYVVNIFELTEDGQIIDYGKYESLRNMTTTDPIGYSNDKVTIDALAGKLYYEGKLNTNIMPWDISIHYYMDGKEYSAEEIAGKSGALKITMSIRENAECNSAFFEGYALQATFMLDTENCKNVIAENATIANVGSDKQLTYTILPNKETDIEITADVTDFEMDAIAINGVQLNLDVEIDDTELQDKISDITQAVNDLDEGAGSLYEGTNELYEGVADLTEGANSLNEGAYELHNATGTLNEKVGELYTGVGTLASGGDTLHAGLVTLTGKNDELTGAAWSAYGALCTAAQTQLNKHLTANGLDPVTLAPENYTTVLMGILSQMDADVVYQQAYNVASQEVTAQVEAQAEELYKGYIQSQADAIYLQYMQTQADTIYTQAATQVVYEQLIAGGYTDAQAQQYLQGADGQTLVAQTVAAMTEEQKAQIIANAVTLLTDAEKQQILQGALASLTEEQKAEIRNAYIQQMMASEEVTQKITAAVEKVNASAAQVTELKGQLDNYGAFYQGLVAYTTGVTDAAKGADTLQGGLDTLLENTNTLKASVGQLNDAVGELHAGTIELKDGVVELNNGASELNNGAKDLNDGTGEFVNETSGMDTQVSDEIDSMISSMSGKDIETVSFVSEQNSNVEAVQFVIKTDAIQIEEVEAVEIEDVKTLNWWQKLLHLFGLD